MSDNAWSVRTQLLIGAEAYERLQESHVLVVGVGGVGAYVSEMLARAGIGHLSLVDGDVINPSNINRQLPALHSTCGMSKVEVMAQRLLDINPALQVHMHKRFLEGEAIEQFIAKGAYDFIVDAIDTLSPKVDVLSVAVNYKIPVISSMGAGAKSDPSQVGLADISKTFSCGLARQVRKRLKRRGIEKGLPVVFSTEVADCKGVLSSCDEHYKASTLGTLSFLPAIFACHLSAYVINELRRVT